MPHLWYFRKVLTTFWPEEIVEEAAKVAIMEAEILFQQAFKSLNSKYIKVKTTPVTMRDRNLAFKNKDYDMQGITVQCCQKVISLRSADIVAGFYCPYCGRIVK